MRGIVHPQVVLVILLSLIQGMSAKLCRLLPNQTDANYANWDSIIIYSQNDINTQQEGCTTIEGGLAIASDYTGSFSLPGVVNLTGGILWQLDPPFTPGLTSFDFPNMITMFVMDLQGVPALTSISMPVLEQISTFSLIGNSSVTIDAGSLVIAETIIIEAIAPQLNFTSLRQVQDRLSIQAVLESTGLTSSSDVSFPSLQNATSITIAGYIASLSMPNLEVAFSENSDLLSSEGIEIDSDGDALVIDFPSLYNASAIYLAGNFKSMSFPSLLTLNGLFSLNSNLPFAVNLIALQSALAIFLEGKISSFSMPAIQDIQTWVQVESQIFLDCRPAQAQFATANSSCVAGNPSSGDAHFFYCNGRKKSLSLGAKVGMAFGILVLLSVLAATVLWATKNWWRRKARNSAQAPAIIISDHELGHVTSPRNDTPLPSKPYPASVHSEIGPLAEPKNLF